MSANSIKVGKTKLSEEELYKLVDDLYEQGVPAYAITGGEPFLEFENMCKMLKYFENKLENNWILELYIQDWITKENPDYQNYIIFI